MKLRLLGGMRPAAFLREHWQKRPLLVRQAIPGFKGILDRDALLGLATRDDVTSRLVIEHPPARRGRASKWERHDGPFLSLDEAMLPESSWTMLVHGVESLVPGGWELLREFSFIPTARVDDLMVSYAADGGSVGPHDDLYDVFLLQGPGQRRWQVSADHDHTVDETAAIKVLKNFVAAEEWLLEPGDMLYLPPGVAHWGVAEDGPCFTYSIGFLAPSHEALLQSFLGYLAPALTAELAPGALYRDPDLRPAKEPLELGETMLDQVAGVLARIRWDRGMLSDYLGRWLTMPRPRAVFAPPRRPLSVEEFAKRLRGKGRLALALPSRGLIHSRRGQLFLNGEASPAGPLVMGLFKQLVRERALALPLRVDTQGRALAMLHGWYASGWVTVTR